MYTGKLFNERLKQIGFLIVIVCLCGVILSEMRYFFSSILGSFALYIMLRRPYKHLLSKGWSSMWATTFLVIVTFLITVGVAGGILAIAYDKVTSFHPQSLLENIRHIHEMVYEKWGYNIFSDDILAKAVSVVGNILPGIIAATGSIVANMVMMFFLLFFMLYQSNDFKESVVKMIPVTKESVELLKHETTNMVITNTVGIPMIMLGQALFAGVGYWIAGAGDPIIWGLATGFFGLIPVVGTGGVWLPLALNLLIGGNIWQGIFLLIWGAAVVASVDNLIRMVFMKRVANVHPMIALLGVILGINLMGFWGIIFGPLVLSGTLLLVKIFKSEFLTPPKQESAP